MKHHNVVVLLTEKDYALAHSDQKMLKKIHSEIKVKAKIKQDINKPKMFKNRKICTKIKRLQLAARSKRNGCCAARHKYASNIKRRREK